MGVKAAFGPKVSEHPIATLESHRADLVLHSLAVILF